MVIGLSCFQTYQFQILDSQTLQICWLRQATKGATSMHLCFTNLCPNAAWRSTWLSSDPWHSVPPYTRLLGFCKTMIYPDLLHVFNLGVARDAAGSIIKKIIQEHQIFRGNTIEDRFEQATISLRDFAKKNAQTLRMKRLTKSKVNWGTKKYPELMASGSDTHIVCTWLEEVLTPFSGVSQELCAFCTLLWSGNRCLRILYAAGWFLDEQEKHSVKMLGGIYVQTFLFLAWEAVTSHKLLFRIKPKMHLFVHVMEHPRLVNGSFYSTWMDEDFLKKISKTLGLSYVKTAQVRLLQRWLLTIPENLRKLRSNA